MAKLEIGDWVHHAASGRSGKVAARCAGMRSVRVRWMGERRADKSTYAVSSLEPKTTIALVMEGVLEDGLLESSRSERPLLRTWLEALGVESVIRAVNRLEDIDSIADRLREIEPTHQPTFIHINCHGEIDSAGRPRIILLDAPIYLDDPRTIETFRKFAGFPVFFSACELGCRGDPMDQFRLAAGLGPIAASTRPILDSEAMLFGLMLYQGVLAGGLEFGTAVHRAVRGSRLLGIKGRAGHAQTYARLFCD